MATNGNGSAKSPRTINWQAGLSAVGGGATGAGLMAVATRASSSQFLSGMLAWSLVTIAGMCTGLAAAWASRRFVHSDELKLQLAHEQQRVTELNDRLRAREQELLRERAERLAEVSRDYQSRIAELRQECTEWQSRFWAVAGIMNAATEQTANMATQAARTVETIAQIVPLRQNHAEDEHEPRTPTGTGEATGTG